MASRNPQLKIPFNDHATATSDFLPSNSLTPGVTGAATGSTEILKLKTAKLTWMKCWMLLQDQQKYWSLKQWSWQSWMKCWKMLIALSRCRRDSDDAQCDSPHTMQNTIAKPYFWQIEMWEKDGLLLGTISASRSICNKLQSPPLCHIHLPNTKVPKSLQETLPHFCS